MLLNVVLFYYLGYDELHDWLRNVMKRESLIPATPAAEGNISPDDYAAYAYALSTLLLIRRILNTAIDHGDGDVVALVVKVLYPMFKANGMKHYAIMCLEMIAQISVLPEKLALMVKQERFFNKHGGISSNIPLDLMVEHDNKLVKERLALYRGEFDSNYLDLISKSHEETNEILEFHEKSFRSYRNPKCRSRCEEKYQQDISSLLDHMVHPFKNKGRKYLTDLQGKIPTESRETLCPWVNKKVRWMLNSRTYK